jgi:hypothetical protein
VDGGGGEEKSDDDTGEHFGIEIDRVERLKG